MTLHAAPTSTPSLSLGLRNFSPAPPAEGWSRLIDQARWADRAGIDRVIVVDHVVMGEAIDQYDGGRFPTGPDGQWIEPMTALSVIAGATTRVRLGTGVILAALRRPVVFAKAAATLDVLSGGRVDLGVGVGWQAKEYEAAGLPFEQRGQLLDETLAVCRALWAESPASYQSERLSFDGVWCEPKPLQPGGIPLWISGRVHPRTLRRIVQFGDGWIPWGEYISDITSGIRQVHAALEEAGRNVGTFQVRGGLSVGRDDSGKLELDKALAPVAELVDAGGTDFSLYTDVPAEEAAAVDTLSEIVAAFRETVGRAGD
jgi:probable F420-dependent oxidoreductase